MYGRGRSCRSSPNRGRTVVDYCIKCNASTGDRGTGRGSRHGRRPWPYGDRADVLAAPAGGVVVAVGGTVLQAWCGDVPRVLQAGVLS